MRKNKCLFALVIIWAFLKDKATSPPAAFITPHLYLSKLKKKELQMKDNTISVTAISVCPKIQNTFFFLFCCRIYQSRLFWCELYSFGDISRRDFCLRSNIIGLNSALCILIHLKNSTVMSLFRNHDSVT